MHTHTYMNANTHTQTHIYINVYICVYMHPYIVNTNINRDKVKHKDSNSDVDTDTDTNTDIDTDRQTHRLYTNISHTHLSTSAAGSDADVWGRDSPAPLYTDATAPVLPLLLSTLLLVSAEAAPLCVISRSSEVRRYLRSAECNTLICICTCICLYIDAYIQVYVCIYTYAYMYTSLAGILSRSTEVCRYLRSAECNTLIGAGVCICLLIHV